MLFARHMLHKDFPAARAVFDEATADREELYEFATALVSITNAVLTSEHGRAFADEYLEGLVGSAARSPEPPRTPVTSPSPGS